MRDRTDQRRWCFSGNDVALSGPSRCVEGRRRACASRRRKGQGSDHPSNGNEMRPPGRDHLFSLGCLGESARPPWHAAAGCPTGGAWSAVAWASVPQCTLSARATTSRIEDLRAGRSRPCSCRPKRLTRLQEGRRRGAAGSLPLCAKPRTARADRIADVLRRRTKVRDVRQSCWHGRLAARHSQAQVPRRSLPLARSRGRSQLDPGTRTWFRDPRTAQARLVFRRRIRAEGPLAPSSEPR